MAKELSGYEQARLYLEYHRYVDDIFEPYDEGRDFLPQLTRLSLRMSSALDVFALSIRCGDFTGMRCLESKAWVANTAYMMQKKGLGLHLDMAKNLRCLLEEGQ